MGANVLIIFNIVMAAICFVFAVFLALKRRDISAGSAVLLFFAMGMWALGVGLEMVTDIYALKQIFLKLGYIGIAFLPPLWMCFVDEFVFHKKPWRDFKFAFVFSMAGIFLMANWFNPFNIFYRSIHLSFVGGVSYLLPTYGPAFYMMMLFNYGALFYTVVRLWVLLGKGAVLPRHVYLMTLGVLGPCACNVFYMLRIVSFDITSLGFAFSILAVFLLHKTDFLQQLPISKNYLFDELADGIILVNPKEDVLDINPAAIKMLGISGTRPEILTAARDFIFEWRQSVELMGSDGGRVLHNYDHPEAGSRHYRISRNYLQSFGNGQNYMLLIQDESDLYNARARIRFLENYDSVTGLMGRQVFKHLLSQEVELCSQTVQTTAIVCAAIVNYNDFCSLYGSAFGEEVQREVGLRIQSMLRKNDAISRFADDEFYLSFRYDASAGDTAVNTEYVIDRLNLLFDAPLQVAGKSVTIRLRYGAAFCPLHSISPDRLISMAKMALTHAMRTSNQLYCSYKDEMSYDISRYMRIEQCLSSALDNEELFVVFHPQIDLVSGRVCGVEALLRWNSRELGNISPAEFIPVAEEGGAIVKIGKWVFKKAAEQALLWEKQGLSNIRMSVNVSIKQLTDPDFARDIIDIIKESGLDPSVFEVEITESMAMTPEVLKTGHLAKLREFNVRIAMDDFGMGHSSLNYIKQFPLNTIKIDRVLSHDILFNPTSAAMVKSVQLLCSSLGMDTVVEFIEHPDQLALLKEIGCNVVQGYVFTPPLSPEKCTAYIKDSMETGLSVGTVAAGTGK